MVRTSRIFMDEILWPEYIKYSSMLLDLMEEVFDSVVVKIGDTQEDTIISGDIGVAYELNS